MLSGLTVHTDFTCVGASPSGLSAFTRSRAGTERKDYFVHKAEEHKIADYAEMCALGLRVRPLGPL